MKMPLMALRVTLLVLLSLTVNDSPAQEQIHDGYWWTGLDQQILKVVKLKDTDVKVLSDWIKYEYLAGTLDALRQLTEAEEQIGRLVSDDQMIAFARTHEPDLKVKTDQYFKGLDAFYADYRNLQLLVSQGMDVVSMEVNGKSREEIEWMTRFYRADSLTRLQMNREKYNLK